jgi:hypothetical protein
MDTRHPLISTDYPGGNVRIDREESGHLWLSPDLRHTQEGHVWFYWSFRAHNREPLTVTFSRNIYMGLRGPAVSRDGGQTWSWLGIEKVRRREIDEKLTEWSFVIPPVAENEDVRYAFCPQYQQSHLERWLASHANHPALSVSTLCTSRNGRAVEMIHIQEPTGSPRPIIFLTARHHACEALGSYVMEGIMEAALANDALGKKLRSHWQIVAIPFVDKDGVEEGDQGKLRAPHDHNRDYCDSPLYPEVAAIIQYTREQEPSIVAFLDLHCPYAHGGIWNESLFLVGRERPITAQRQREFAEVFQKHHEGPIPFNTPSVLEFGQEWNVTSTFTAGGKSASKWASVNLPNAHLVTSIETPYASASGKEVNAQSARQIGRDLATALSLYLPR